MSEIIDVESEQVVEDLETSFEKLLAYRTESAQAIDMLRQQVTHLANRIVGIETMLSTLSNNIIEKNNDN